MARAGKQSLVMMQFPLLCRIVANIAYCVCHFQIIDQYSVLHLGI